MTPLVLPVTTPMKVSNVLRHPGSLFQISISRGGFTKTFFGRPPWSKYLHFPAIFGKIWPNYRFVPSPLGLVLALGNPGSAPDFGCLKKHQHITHNNSNPCKFEMSSKVAVGIDLFPLLLSIEKQP